MVGVVALSGLLGWAIELVGTLFWLLPHILVSVHGDSARLLFKPFHFCSVPFPTCHCIVQCSEALALPR